MTYPKRTPAVFADRQKNNIKLNLAIMGGLFLLSVLYLAQINAVVAKNFELRSARTALGSGQEDNQRITISLMGTRALAGLEEAAKNFNLVSVDKVGYLSIISSSVAFSQEP